MSIMDFDQIKIGLASPEQIRNWSHGEVSKPETINYRTFKPEKDGLFCAKIFGPVNDYECICGKYKRPKYKGVICEKCGVEVTTAKVRRERMGHIELASPIAHIWFFKGLPSRVGLILNIPSKDIEKIVYFESYIVIDKGDTPLKKNQILSEEEYKEAKVKYGNAFKAMMGAEALLEILKRIDVELESKKLREAMKKELSSQKKHKLAKRLEIMEAFKKSGNKPEYMILQVLPVLPPDLRPLVRLDGGRFATSDLNDLYRRVINRNNRLKRLLETRAPELIIRNEKRMLQEAVDALFDNGRRARAHLGSNGRPLKSLSEYLKGKQGRFRHNLLGKRVDYSGRSVIVVGPELKLHQCGLPKKMAIELFKPFLYNRLVREGVVSSTKEAKLWVEQEPPEVWEHLEEIVKEHPVLLNRAPTLHRLGIQAFEPVLIDGRAIKIHPLVCTAFNADFDGDQMAVHIPLSAEAQIEASVLMLSSHNILSPAHGKPLAVPTQDMILGCYYLTLEKMNQKGEGKIFASKEEALYTYEIGEISLHASIKVDIQQPLMDLSTYYDNQDIINCPVKEYTGDLINTTVGRIILNSYIPSGLPFINGLLKKKGIQNLVYYTYLMKGLEPTLKMLDDLKELGFYYATKAGFSIGIEDMVIPEEKDQLIKQAQEEVNQVEKQYLEGSLSSGERYNKVVGIWESVTNKIGNVMFSRIEKESWEGNSLNSLFIMADSGARGSKQQIQQLSGIRGLMAKPSGEIIETPITSNLREGLSVLQYFISTHGARKGLADTALKTANSGYLTRKLVDVSHDVIVSEYDCGTIDGLFVSAIVENGEIIEPFEDRIIGRTSLETIVEPDTGKLIVNANEEITEEIANEIINLGIERVKIRSVLTCESKRGVCQLCYGRNMATGKLVELGEAVGIIAAQSIGEPGTQLTMRTFHIGGVASKIGEQSRLMAKNDGTVKFINLSTVKNKGNDLVITNRNGYVAIVDEKGKEKEHYQIVYGAKLKVNNGEKIKKNQTFVEWDPYTSLIISEVNGTVEYRDIDPDITVEEEKDELTGLITQVIIEWKDEKKQPQLWIRDGSGKVLKKYHIPVGARLNVKDKSQVFAGDILVKIPRKTAKTKDITGGLPRAVDLFEARVPDPKKMPLAVVTEIDGRVKILGISRGSRKIKIINENQTEKEYAIPKGAHLRVQEDEKVKAGDPLNEGAINPHDILRILGEKALADYLLKEIQEVYRLQGVTINDKHIEIIIRQMMRWVIVEDVGDTNFIVDERVDRFKFQEENEKVIAKGGKPAKARPILLGISKAALSNESFISAASFQETTRVLTDASISGRIDFLKGLKENVIMGRLIPAGTGYHYYRAVEVMHEEIEGEKEVSITERSEIQ
ncbi:MAG: DNA-directed RNA polymerase subunit beta' [Acidobacteriota bacterium]